MLKTFTFVQTLNYFRSIKISVITLFDNEFKRVLNKRQ